MLLCFAPSPDGSNCCLNSSMNGLDFEPNDPFLELAPPRPELDNITMDERLGFFNDFMLEARFIALKCVKLSLFLFLDLKFPAGGPGGPADVSVFLLRRVLNCKFGLFGADAVVFCGDDLRVS